MTRPRGRIAVRMQMEMAALCLILLIHGCGGLIAQDDPESRSFAVSARALSEHYVSVLLAEPADSLVDTSLYTIATADGVTLSVLDAIPGDDPNEVILATEKQSAVEYTLALDGSSSVAVSFLGSEEPEPRLLNAIALTSTSVLLVFSEDLAAATVGGSDAYDIHIESTDEVVGVSASKIGEASNLVLLTTAQQVDAAYVVSVGGVKSNADGNLIDPTSNLVEFQGQPSADTIPPSLLSVEAINNTSLRLIFSEPLEATAVDIENFAIAPALSVTSSALELYDTQILLTTSPQNPSLTYVVTVENVRDLAGNIVDPTAKTALTAAPGADLFGDDSSLPRVIGAVATSNTSVVVSYNRSMSIDALVPTNYFIVPEAGEAEAAVLKIVGEPEFLTSLQTSVRFTTLSQSEDLYVITAVNVTDQSGNPLAPKSPLLDPTSATFAGIPFSCSVGPCDIPDADADGVPDSVEQSGWIVTVKLINDELSQRHVTSDPFTKDTDGDGLDDATELSLVIDPRQADSDGDLLSDADEFNVYFSEPANHDTDGDELSDNLEVAFYRTSPILADTDGDSFSDSEELLEMNRDPRVADLPRPAFSVGTMNIEIDERYSTTTEQGDSLSLESSSSTSLEQSSSSSLSSSDSTVNGTAWEAFGKAGFKFETGKKSFAVEGGYTHKAHDDHTTQFSSESATAAQNTYEESLFKGRELSTSTAVTREVVDARVDVNLTIQNAGEIAFSLSGIEISMLQSAGDSHTAFEPIGTLVANSALILGDNPTYNIGPFTEQVGPLLFSDVSIFPAQVDDLLREPRGLIFQVTNYNLTDEFGRSFAFASQSARDRTAGVTIDYGDGTVDRFLIATAGAFDVNEFAGGGYVGGFDAETGQPLGLPLDFILQDTMGFAKNSTTTDSIIAGANGVAESLAAGDDVQLIPIATFGLEDDAIVIGAGANGILDSIPVEDDEEAITTGYATSATCSAETDIVTDPDDPDIYLEGPGFPCASDSDCLGAGTCTGAEALVRVRHRQLGDFNRVWVLFTTNQIPVGADFGSIAMYPGEDITLAFVQDLDRDGLFAREEYFYGSSDKSKDSDGDGLGDFAEVRVGWDVGVEGAESILKVFPNPRLADSDGDGLLDIEEQDLRRLWCRCSGGDADGLACGDDGDCSNGGVCECQDSAYVCTGGNEDGTPCSSDASCSEDGVCEADDSVLFGETFDDLQFEDGPVRSDPRSRDSDGDGVTDMDEIAGYLIGVSIRDPDPESGFADTQALSDDVQKVFINQPVGPSGVLILPGANGQIDSNCSDTNLSCGPGDDLSCCGGDDYLFPGLLVQTNPLDPDHDDDTRTDGAERDGGSDPKDPDDSDDFVDSDLDGMSDAAEESVGWIVPNFGYVFSSKYVGDTDFDGLPDLLERELKTDPTRGDTDGDGLDDFDEFTQFDNYASLGEIFPGFVLDGTGSLLLGTEPTKADTDDDGLDDLFEATIGWNVLLGGDLFAISPNPLLADSDQDGASDLAEFLGEDGIAPPASVDATDPSNPDTDGDGTLDGPELEPGGSDPLKPDLIVGVRIVALVLKEAYIPEDSEVLFAWKFTAEVPGLTPVPIEFSSSAMQSSCFPGLFDAEPNCYPSTGLIFDSPGGELYSVSFDSGVDFTPDCSGIEQQFALNEGQSLRLRLIMQSPASADLCDPGFDQVVECGSFIDQIITFEDILAGPALQQVIVDFGVGTGINECTDSEVIVELLRY